MNNSGSLREFVTQIYRTYIQERPTHFAASLAYYSLFSLVPIIYVAFSLAGLFIDNESTAERMMENIESKLGADVAEMLVTTLEQVTEGNSRSSMLQRSISFMAMLAGASLVFFQLQYALTCIWRIPPVAKGGTRQFVLNRLLAFVMVVCVGLLVVLVTLTNFVISFLDLQLNIEAISPLVSFGTTVVIGMVSVALMFKYLPNAIVSWKDVFVGGFFTTLLLIGGAKILGWYVARGSCASAFEAAGTVAVLLIAVYFLAQFLVFGTVFTRVYANTFGNGIRPRVRADTPPDTT
jgi:membrane protein